ncbi:MAG: hypothetical protein R3B93_10610 [Bacteroidia bacterium]
MLIWTPGSEDDFRFYEDSTISVVSGYINDGKVVLELSGAPGQSLKELVLPLRQVHLISLS